MINYIGVKCPHCKEEFTKESDVVVCPDCGTPHHRHCYSEVGHCVNEYKHIEGYEFENPNKVAIQAVGKTLEYTCPECNEKYPVATKDCKKCGADMSEVQAKESFPKINPIASQQSKTNKKPSPQDIIENLSNRYEGEIDGVSARDLAVYLGPSANVYMAKFYKMQNAKFYIPFSPSAALFGGIFFIYRKLWVYGAIAFLLNQIIALQFSDALVTVGATLSTQDSLWSMLFFVVNMAYGFIALPLLKNKAVSDIKKMKQKSASENEYKMRLMQNSGPSKIVLAMAFTYTIMMFLNLIF